MLAILGVKMGRGMICKIHPDDDAIKAANLRHGGSHV
jgi:hypothetical protein